MQSLVSAVLRALPCNSASAKDTYDEVDVLLYDELDLGETSAWSILYDHMQEARSRAFLIVCMLMFAVLEGETDEHVETLVRASDADILRGILTDYGVEVGNDFAFNAALEVCRQYGSTFAQVAAEKFAPPPQSMDVIG